MIRAELKCEAVMEEGISKRYGWSVEWLYNIYPHMGISFSISSAGRQEAILD
jgi:hypothetical protein